MLCFMIHTRVDTHGVPQAQMDPLLIKRSVLGRLSWVQITWQILPFILLAAATVVTLRISHRISSSAAPTWWFDSHLAWEWS